MEAYEKLMAEIKSYIHKAEDLKLISEAYELAASKHEGQLRKSGEPYIIHPVNVALILANLRVGPNTIIAGILHDVVEDTDTTLEMLKEH